MVAKFSIIRHVFSNQKLPFDFGTLMLFSKLIIYVYVQYWNLSKKSLSDDAENRKSKGGIVYKFISRK